MSGMILIPAMGLGTELALSPADQDAVFSAAGFKAKGGDYVLCEDDVTASYMPGRIELADLNRDGQAEAWVKESSLYCYGDTAEYFVLVTKNSGSSWVKLLAEIGVPLELESRHNGWPGASPFPVYVFDGSTYVPDR